MVLDSQKMSREFNLIMTNSIVRLSTGHDYRHQHVVDVARALVSLKITTQSDDNPHYDPAQAAQAKDVLNKFVTKFELTAANDPYHGRVGEIVKSLKFGGNEINEHTRLIASDLLKRESDGSVTLFFDHIRSQIEDKAREKGILVDTTFYPNGQTLKAVTSELKCI